MKWGWWERYCPPHTMTAPSLTIHAPRRTNPFNTTRSLQVNNGVWEVTSQCQLSALVDALKMYKATYKVQLEPPASQ